jgi:signal transduction histidine kinase
MGQVVEEGRSALKRLRSSDGGNSLDLEQAFSRIRQELAAEEEIDFRITVEGRPRPVHPIIRDEVYRIGREAVLNAFRRSRAKRIEITLIYRAKHLRVVISDKGGGIDLQVPRSEREGDGVLSGMRERAERIGARLKVRSRAAAETEVELSVPGYVAFQGQPSKSPLKWFTVWMREMPGRGLQKQRREESK